MTPTILDEIEFGAYKDHDIVLQTVEEPCGLSYSAIGKHKSLSKNETSQGHESPQAAIASLKGIIDSKQSASDNAEFDVHSTDPTRLKEEVRKDLKRG